jgi:small glutamine-rich tetratricopeptide repeat-containing protein alpha
MPFNPSNLASMFMAAANAGQGSHSQEGQEDANSSGANEPEIRFGGNVNVNQDQIPQELRGAFQSVMHMFSGNAPPGQPHDQMNGSHEDANSEDNEADIQFGGNVNLNSDQIPQELSGVFQNVMEMLSGNAPPGQPHDQTNERTAPN